MTGWRYCFDKATLEKGQSLLSEDKVSYLTEEDFGYRILVKDENSDYVSIHLNYDNRIQRLNCTCSETSSNQTYCAHMVAALLYAEMCLGEKLFLSDSLEKQIAESRMEKELANARPAKGVKKPSRAKAAVKKTKGQKLLSTYADGVRELSAMQENEQKEREASQDSFSSKAAEPYLYFRPELFRTNVQISKTALLKAQRLLDSLRPTMKIEVGYMRVPHDSYGSSGSEDASAKNISAHATLYDNKGYYMADMYLDREGPVHSICRNWSCAYRRTYHGRLDHELCEHETALLLLAEQHFRKNPVGDATSKSALSLFQSFGTIQKTAPQKQATLHLEPQIRVDRFNDWYVQFKVGEGRLYKVPNIQDFSFDVAAGKSVTFGRSTTLQLSEDAFDEEGKKWLAFLRESIHILAMFSGLEREARRDVFYYDPESGWARVSDKLPLSGEILDRLFDAVGAGTITFERTIPEKEKCNLRMVEVDLRPALSVKPSFLGNTLEGIVVTGRLPLLLHGSTGSYFRNENDFCRISKTAAANLAPLFQSMDKNGELRIEVGRRRLAEFWRIILPKLQEIADLTVEGASSIEEYLPSEAAFLAYLDVQDGVVLCRPEVYYDHLRHSPFDVYAFEAKEKMPEAYRDVPAEAHLVHFLEQYLAEHDVEAGLFLSNTDEAALFEFLDHGLTDLMSFAEVRASERFRALKVRRRMPVQVGVSLDSGLMDISLTSEEFTPDELLEILNGYRRKAKYVRLTNGDFVGIEDNEAIRQMNELLDALHLAPKSLIQEKMQIPAFRALYLDRMLESMQDVYSDRDRHFKSLIKEFKTVSDADFPVPPTLKGILRKYQITGYRWLRTLDTYGFGGILADDMGLGKTLQAIAVLLSVLAEEANAGPSIIVCPASLVYNWQDELSRFAPALRTLPVVGPAAERRTLIAGADDFDVLITSYDYAKRDFAEYKDRTFRFAIVDEAQYIKNQTTAAAKSVKLLKARTRFALTGTPIENKLSDLWSIFDFLMPGFLYSYNEFRSDIEMPIVKSDDEYAKERLHRMVTPFILRRSKKEVLTDLPDKLEEVRYAAFEKGGEQQKLYDASVVRLKKELRAKSEEEFGKSRIQILAELTRIRQLCCDPRLLMENYNGESAKREACIDLVRSAVEGEHKVLLFSQFTSMFELLEEDLRSEGIAWYKITGATPKEERARLVKAFNQDDIPVFLISLKAGGTGLNLTGADVVIHYDPWWNAAAQNQATDRAHRIGQTKVVTVYRLILKNTIEDRILELQEKKKALADDILSAEAVGSARISRDELLELLG